MPQRRASFLALVLILTTAAHLRAQTPLGVTVGSAESGWPARIHIGDLLADPGLRGALDSALPLRFHLRLELWRKGLLDRLIDFDEVSVAVLQDPLGDGYWVETANSNRRVRGLAEAQRALADLLDRTLRPRGPGRHYYLATLEVETLSLSDLDELRRWLRGEVVPAIEGRSPGTRAVERGVRRLMVRVIGLPTRRYEARTGTFVVG